MSRVVDFQMRKTGRKHDRRKASVPRATISQILQFMQDEADLNHAGDVETYALTIFNQLGTDDKRTFLRQSVRALWEKQIELSLKSIDPVVVDAELTIEPDKVIQEEQALEDNKPLDSKAFGTFVMGLIMVVLVAMFFLVVGWSFVTGATEETKESAGFLSKLLTMLISL